MAAADFGYRLRGMLPRGMLNDPDPERIAVAAARLEQAGFIALTCDPNTLPADDGRIVIRTLNLSAGGFTAVDRRGVEHRIPAGGVALFQKGTRVTTTTETEQTTERNFSLGRAALSGGLILTKKVEKTTTHTSTAHDTFIVINRVDGPDVILYEKRTDYRFLGAALQPASNANLMKTLATLRALAPAAPFDDRVGRPGFVTGQLATRADPVDLALHLVRLAVERGV